VNGQHDGRPTPAELRRPVGVLLLEPDATVADTIARVLRRRGMRVARAHDGHEALRRLRAEAFDLVIGALEMPRPDGWDLLDQVYEHQPHAAFVALSNDTDARNVVRAMRRGAVDYVPKPLSLDALVDRIGAALDSRTLRRHVGGPRRRSGELVASSAAMRTVLALVDKVAQSPIDAALILGESGVGKEEVARAIHRLSARRHERFIAVNVAALPGPLIESELFGHRQGAFTGAAANREGLLASADGGTLLLDEIGEMPMAFQAKLLRVLEERAFFPVGSDAERHVDVRILAATNRDPHEAISSGTLRADLYYRLARVVIRIPPLRERPDDILPLAYRFLRDAAERAGRPAPTLAEDAELALREHPWPGNVRELRNTVERAVLLNEGSALTDTMLGLRDAVLEPAAPPSLDLVSTRERVVASVEREMIERALRVTDGSLSKAAKLLNVSRTTLWNRVRRYGLDT